MASLIIRGAGTWCGPQLSFGTGKFCLEYSCTDCEIPFVTRRTKKKWNGPLQYEDPSKQLMMLPTDLVRLPTLVGTQYNYFIHVAVQLAALGAVRLV